MRYLIIVLLAGCALHDDVDAQTPTSFHCRNCDLFHIYQLEQIEQEPAIVNIFLMQKSKKQFFTRNKIYLIKQTATKRKSPFIRFLQKFSIETWAELRLLSSDPNPPNNLSQSSYKLYLQDLSRLRFNPLFLQAKGVLYQPVSLNWSIPITALMKRRRR